MPNLKPGESKNSFISRCVREVMSEGKTQDEALGQCYGMFESQKKQASASIHFNKDDEILIFNNSQKDEWEEIFAAKVDYADKELYQRVRQDANKKFDKDSYVKNLWVLKEYKKHGGKVKQSGKKPSAESIKKQVKAGCVSVDFSSEDDFDAIVDELTAAVSEGDKKKLGKHKLNKPFRTPGGPKKFAVYVRDGDNIKIVRFGDSQMEIRRDDPERRKNFRARHNCDNPGPKTKARWWSCQFSWSPNKKVAASTDCGCENEIDWDNLPEESELNEGADLEYLASLECEVEEDI